MINFLFGRGPGLTGRTSRGSADLNFPAYSTEELQEKQTEIQAELDKLIAKEAIDSGHATVLDSYTAELFATFYDSTHTTHRVGLRNISERDRWLRKRYDRASRTVLRHRHSAAVKNHLADMYYFAVFGTDRPEAGMESAVDTPSPLEYSAQVQETKYAGYRGEQGAWVPSQPADPSTQAES